MNELNEAYEDWISRPFPSGSDADWLDELHADLVLADTWVSESVIPYVKHGRFVRPHLDVVEEISKLYDRMTSALSQCKGDERQLLKSYQDYARALLRVYKELPTNSDT